METGSISPGKLPIPIIKAVPALVGFTAVVGQSVLLREMISLFSGNEISLGISLAVWLMWTAAGSAVASRACWERVSPRAGVAALECITGASLAPSIWLLREGRAALQTAPGELLGPIPMLLAALVAMSLFCGASGALFVTAARLVREDSGDSPGIAAGRVYLLEALGSGLGGIVASALFLSSIGSFAIAIMIAFLNFVAAASVFLGLVRWHMAFTALLGSLSAIFLAGTLAPKLDRATLMRLWRGLEVVSSRNTIYGNLTLGRLGALHILYDNGVKLATVPDEAAAEEAVHYAMLQHPAPVTVLLVGGGLGGDVQQALEHPSVRRIDWVELNPALLKIARQLASARMMGAFSDPRVHVHVADARLWLKNTKKRFDVILLDLPDPETAQLNRFYTEEFFRSARGHLAPHGIFSFQVRSSAETISPNLAAFLSCMGQTARAVFPYVTVLPGESMHFFAAEQPGLLTEDPQLLIARLQERKLPTQYVREYFIPFRMTADRMYQSRALLQHSAKTPINRDFRPLAYYFNIVLWSAQFRSGYATAFATAARVPFALLLTCTLVLLLLFLLPAVLPRRPNSNRIAALACAGVGGYTLMGLQLLLLLSFQSVYGFVYQESALLIGLFLAGTGLGSWLGLRRAATGTSDCLIASIARTQLVLSASSPVLLLVVELLARAAEPRISLFAAQVVFPLLALLCGLPGGYLFPLTTAVWLHGRSTPAGAGTVYAFDLVGGALGALLLSGYCIPVFGFWNAAWFTAAVSVAPALLIPWISLREPISPADPARRKPGP